MYDCEGMGVDICNMLHIPHTYPWWKENIPRKEELSHNSLNYEELDILFRLNLCMPVEKGQWNAKH